MAIRILGLVNRVINKTTTEILDNQVINKITNVVSTFLNSGVEAIRDMTREEPEETEDTRETPG